MRADLIERLRAGVIYDKSSDNWRIDEAHLCMEEAADALASQEPVEPLYILSASLRKNIPNGHLSSMMLGWRRGFTEDAAKGSFLSTIQQDKPGFSVVELLCTQVHASPVVPIAAKAEAEGWRRVPSEPTDAMIDAGVAEAHGKNWGVVVANCYRAMLAAAPTGKGDGQP